MLIQHTGLTYHRAGAATPGYKLYSPTMSDQVYLIDLDGELVHQWSVVGKCTNANMLLPNGNLFIAERGDYKPPIVVGAGGLLREYDWDSNVVWEAQVDMQHHDARRLPDGGAVYAAWELLDSADAARCQGGVSGTELDMGTFSEVIREIDASGHIVWEWRAAELIDKYPFHHNAVRENYGHCNTIDVLADGNYLISLKTLNLLIIIDRQTSKVIWEFQDDTLGGQHDAQMTPQGTVLVFGNGIYANDMHHSAVWEINPKTNEVVWQYKAELNPISFFSPFISGCQRLSSGNTLICEGGKGCIFEVTPEKEVIWEYINPNWAPHPVFKNINFVFRARHYDPESTEIGGRI